MKYEAVIVDAVRTPLGKRDGMLKSWHPVDLLGHTLNGLVQRNKLKPELVDDIIAGPNGRPGPLAAEAPMGTRVMLSTPHAIAT